MGSYTVLKIISLLINSTLRYILVELESLNVTFV